MRAIVCKKYGPVSNLKVEEVAKPEPKEGEVLIKVRCTAVNDYDWSMVRGKPVLYRLLFGLTKPKHQIPGMELSGVVESLGPGSNKFRVGDAVYGDTSEVGFGTFAEHIALNEKALIRKPESMSFEEAVTIPHAALLAYQGMVELGRMEYKHKVLINGAGGGVGTFGLQLAKTYHAEVTGVDTGDKLKTMQEFGFDHVIDYKQQNFTRSGEKYDLILDAKTSLSPYAYLKALRPGGTYVTVGGKLIRLLQITFQKGLIRLLFNKKLKVLPLKPNKGLELINRIHTDGNLKCIIDGPYPLEKGPWAIQYFGDGLHKGKVVIAVS